MILADTSVWIEHLHRRPSRLAPELEANTVVTHPLVIGELACGNIPNRAAVLRLLARLPQVPVATDSEAMAYIEERRLMGRGVGFIDVHLLASVALADEVTLWTLDVRLASLASR